MRKLERYLTIILALGGWKEPHCNRSPEIQIRYDYQKYYRKIFGPQMERFNDIKLDYDVAIILYHPLPATGPRLSPSTVTPRNPGLNSMSLQTTYHIMSYI